MKAAPSLLDRLQSAPSAAQKRSNESLLAPNPSSLLNNMNNINSHNLFTSNVASGKKGELKEVYRSSFSSMIAKERAPKPVIAPPKPKTTAFFAGGAPSQHTETYFMISI